jgi:hypothetical protein
MGFRQSKLGSVRNKSVHPHQRLIVSERNASDAGPILGILCFSNLGLLVTNLVVGIRLMANSNRSCQMNKSQLLPETFAAASLP